MKANVIATAKKAELITAAKEAGLTIDPKLTAAEHRKELMLHYFPAPNAGEETEPSTEQKEEALQASKDAKKPLPHRVALGKVFDSLHVLLPSDALSHDKGHASHTVHVAGLSAEFWRAKVGAADFGGVSLRYTNPENDQFSGIEKAILGNLKKALKKAGLTLADEHSVSCTTIRKAGSFGIFG